MRFSEKVKLSNTPAAMPHQALPFLLLLAISHAALLTTFGAPPAAAPERNINCREKCGDVHIPYPFGIGSGCYLDPSFELTCNVATNPPVLRTGNLEIASITLETAKVVVYNYLTFSCHNKTWGQTVSVTLRLRPPFLISPSDNVFTAIGCSSIARLTGRSDDTYFTGCITTCKNVNNTEEDGTPCAGHGCCEASLTPGRLDQVSVSLNGDEKGDKPVVAGNLCQYAFVAIKGWYSFRQSDLEGLNVSQRFGNPPVVFDWAIRNGTCPSQLGGGNKKVLTPYGHCISTDSHCVNASDATPGYFCRCNKGFVGNPYIENGCTNINECILQNPYPCRGGTCHDLMGDYACRCNFGGRGDGKSQKGCEPIMSLAEVIGTVSAISISAVLLIFTRMILERKKLRDLVKKNGGQLLKSIKIEIYKKEELDKITKNYSTIIGKGAFGEVYKGTTNENVQVAVKRSIAINKDREKDFANEIRIQSQMSHKYLVQLLGCCLETEVPMLVYEFVERGSLYDVLHGMNGNGRRQPLSLQARLDIAICSADAFAYMHSQASQKILHGDVKSGNILLDDEFVPKVSDFGTSRLMSIKKDHTDWVIGDSSYIDPVYMKTGLLTEKSDVYSFGIVLLELITRKKARYDGNNSLPLNYVKASLDGSTGDMYDTEVLSSGQDVKCLGEIGLIAVQCLEIDVNGRPTMTDVAEKIRRCKSRWLQSH